ncbi:M23 family metallopeptidase [Maribellus sp. YY47]|uniref:M23 family metallopeptidase n=1 Tax=Maribellus sp. YY47 TaxID=2929486 RepID=UPI0020008452|nr:M23 family metallopeptidase [Maribellus sp. YY47]MCK3686143.1 M23 family metallopeptidase [Maribellus sp. YY47]
MKAILLIFAVLSGFGISAQEKYFSDPLKIPLLLSGSFAELRANHFHSGIDIKTNGGTGLPVYAVADGYISRISVSPSGFGNALYIVHPNGTTSVYGHLERFSPAIKKYVTDQQYEQLSFRVDLQVPSFLFPVKRGDEIAKSGNSGSSGGPHLHFEIRDTKSEEPLNPLDYGFSVADNTPPKLYSLLVVPLSDTSHVNYQPVSASYPVVFVEGKYHVKGDPVIPVYGPVGFAIEANDYLDGSYNKCGINKLSLSVDGMTSFAFLLDRFSFDHSRYINSHIVYGEYIESGRRFIKTWVDPGNQLPIYTYDFSNGVLAEKSGRHSIRMELSDSYGNSSSLQFNVEVKFKKVNSAIPAEALVMKYNKENSFKSGNCELEIPKGALYSDFEFTYREEPTTLAFYSDFHKLADNKIPLHVPAEIKIKARNLPVELEQKALIVSLNSKSGQPSAVGGSFKNGCVEGSIRSLGVYAVMVDTIPPVIKSLSIAGGSLTESPRVRFKISDDLSGIKSIEGKLDGKWALFEYDAKSNLITHYFDKSRFEFGKQHELVLEVVDYAENVSVYKAGFWK